MQFAILMVLIVIAVCAYAKPIAIATGGGFGGRFGGGFGRGIRGGPVDGFGRRFGRGIRGGPGAGFGGGFLGGVRVEGGGGEFKPLPNLFIPSPIRSMFKYVVREQFM